MKKKLCSKVQYPGEIGEFSKAMVRASKASCEGEEKIFTSSILMSLEIEKLLKRKYDPGPPSKDLYIKNVSAKVLIYADRVTSM
jgi:hypothetical protein